VIPVERGRATFGTLDGKKDDLAFGLAELANICYISPQYPPNLRTSRGEKAIGV